MNRAPFGVIANNFGDPGSALHSAAELLVQEFVTTHLTGDRT